MTIGSLSTALLALTGPVTALMLAAFLLRRRTDGASSVWLAVWLTGLALRFGKSTLNALFGLEPWALNLGLAGMLAAPAALYLGIRALGAGPQGVTPKDLIHLAPALGFAVFSPWIPNERGDPASAYIYMCVLAVWAAYLLAGARGFAIADSGHSQRSLFGVALIATAVMGALFALIFVWAPQLYLLNGVVFSLTVVGIAGLTIADASAQKRGRARAEPATSEQSALVARARAALNDPAALSDVNTNLARLARKLGVPQKALSTAINRVTRDSFTTLLNSMRLEAAQRLMRETDDPLEAIAARCGFSSSSAFHRTFRRHLHTTPAAWRTAERPTQLRAARTSQGQA